MEERSERCSGSKRKGEESEQWITKQVSCPTSSRFFLIFSVSLLFSKQSCFHHRFLLPLAHCFCFLHPIALAVALPLPSFFLVSLITVSFSLLLYLSPSLSLRRPPVFSVYCSFLPGRHCANDGSCSGHGPALPLSTHSNHL